MPSRTTALIACLAVAAALRPTAPSRLSTTPRRAGAAVADVSDGYLTPQMIRTLRKEVDDRRRRKRLALARVADAETGGDFEDATVRGRAVAKLQSAFKTHCAVFGADRGGAAGRDVDIPRATERAERTKIDSRR